MAKIRINQNWCKGCGLCLEICPKNVYDRDVKVSSKGFREIIIKKPEACTRCLLCELLCPDLAITIEKNKDHAAIES
ncbi:MAG: ferredoxin family protein [candidate division WOR-3 bacterium]